MGLMSWDPRFGKGRSNGYTLVEVLVVVTILGLAGMMVIPSLGQADVLRVQGAVRSIVADLTFAQSDALAYQEERAVVFDTDENRYTLVAVLDGIIDVDANALYDPSGPDQRYAVDFDDPRWGGAQLDNPSFDGDGIIIFDELGGPVLAPGSDEPAGTGSVDVIGSNSRMRVTVEAFTGHITVAEVPTIQNGGS
ncbi:MAG: prepilin-type N-terminal cleavage/methylation domain-containing protein [Planctomycetota bacterium]|nr:MAG: prepilin-type N-terminal cleavage/methylation domain-containing protein [Planctomycetota bacterium]